MATIELTGRVNEKGEIEFEPPVNLPPGEVWITIEYDDDAIAADEALWDDQFARSQDLLDKLSEQAHQEYLAGLTEDFDPDNDPDAPEDL